MADCLTTTKSETAKDVCPHCGQAVPVDLKIDLERNLAIANGAWVRLTAMQAEILETIRQDGPIKAHEIVLRTKGPYGHDIGPNCIRTQICYVRPKLREIGIGIGHIHGRGYVMTP